MQPQSLCEEEPPRSKWLAAHCIPPVSGYPRRFNHPDHSIGLKVSIPAVFFTLAKCLAERISEIPCDPAQIRLQHRPLEADRIRLAISVEMPDAAEAVIRKASPGTGRLHDREDCDDLTAVILLSHCGCK
jgi:hypothetical protein